MKRSLWSGAISFGLVHIPVKLYSSVKRESEVHFHLLHEKDGGRIREKRICELDGKEVPWEQVVKGYELPSHESVIITPQELAQLIPEATCTIDIEQFVELADIDPIYYNSTYYVVPEKSAGKAYGLLHEAMSSEQKVAISRVVIRGKQHLCSLRPMESLLALSTMQFAAEIVQPGELPTPSGGGARAAEGEREMAKKLIQSLSAPFRAERYKDEYREQVLALVKKKAKGRAVAPPPKREPKGGDVLDLMEALRASLAKKRARTPTRAKASARARAHR